MSWRSGALSLIMLGLLTSCGFRPLYADNAGHPALAPELAEVHVRQISNRYGQEMTNELRDAFNPYSADTDKPYELSVLLIDQRADVAMRQDGTASRTDSSLTAQWTLTRLKDKSVVATGTSRAITGHDIVPNEYSNVVSLNTDVTRAIHEVSTDIETRIAAYFRTAA